MSRHRSVAEAAAAAVLALALAPLTAQAGSAAADSAGRFMFRDVRAGGESVRLGVWLPPGFEARPRWPAILYLHGSGESGADGRAPTRIGLGPALNAHPERWPFVVVFPQKPRDEEEWDEREPLVFAALDAAVREFRVDRDRVALVGMSQGGHGVWRLGARHPARWTCLVPICGYGRARSVASRVARLPVWAFHGLLDDQVNPEDTRVIVAAIHAERTRLGLGHESVRRTLYPDANHNSWDRAFAEPDLPGWIQEQCQARRGTR